MNIFGKILEIYGLINGFVCFFLFLEIIFTFAGH